jgi:hypothetical protein
VTKVAPEFETLIQAVVLESVTRTTEAKKKRVSYGVEFKAKVGLEAVRGVKTINGLAQEYGRASGAGWTAEEGNPGASRATVRKQV